MNFSSYFFRGRGGCAFAWSGRGVGGMWLIRIIDGELNLDISMPLSNLKFVGWIHSIPVLITL